MVGFQKLSFSQPQVPIFFRVSVQFSTMLPFSWKGTTSSNDLIVVHTPFGLFSEQYDSVKSVWCLCIFRSFWSTQFPISGSNRYISGIFDKAQTFFGALEMFFLFENYWKVFLFVLLDEVCSGTLASSDFLCRHYDGFLFGRMPKLRNGTPDNDSRCVKDGVLVPWIRCFLTVPTIVDTQTVLAIEQLIPIFVVNIFPRQISFVLTFRVFLPFTNWWIFGSIPPA